MPVPTPDDTTDSAEGLVNLAAELTDEEVAKVGAVLLSLQQKYGPMANTAENLDAMRDEALTRFMELNVLATVDPAPCFYGEPPVIEIIGKVPGDSLHKDGFDHEKKQYEVLKANELGEDYRGQKESYNKRKGGKKNA